MKTIKFRFNNEALAKIPSTFGVYLFTKKGKAIYIGKAANLKARIKSHIESAKIDRKEELIVVNSDGIEVIITDSEFGALVLESELIKTHHPKYNTRWKDNKSYLYIKITVKEKYPKVLLSRRENDGRSKYFGPFSSVQSATEIIKQVRRIIPFCTQKKISRYPCFYSKINLCSPCPNAINKVKDIRIREKLQQKYKRNILKILKILKGSTKVVLNDLKGDLQRAIKSQNYEQAIVLRNSILRFENFIHRQLTLKDGFSAPVSAKNRIEKLQSYLINYFPQISSLSRIECYDISSFAQKEGVGSMVVFVSGQADKSQYRRFRIKNPFIHSDFEMLEEVLERRFRQSWPRPDLILVDGGKPQVRVFIKVLAQLKQDIPVVGIAKNPDRLIIGNINLPTLRLQISNPAFNLIRLIRDESHRFAKKYHLYLRTQGLKLI
jgi:excinuclease ABC subunit C